MIEHNQTNSKAVVSLTLGILSIVIPFLGLILGVIGVFVSLKSTKEIEKTNATGKGLAVSGLICSIVGLVIQLFVILGFVAFFSLTSVQIAALGVEDGWRYVEYDLAHI